MKIIWEMFFNRQTDICIGQGDDIVGGWWLVRREGKEGTGGVSRRREEDGIWSMETLPVLLCLYWGEGCVLPSFRGGRVNNSRDQRRRVK